MSDILIIGGGLSGLFAACLSAKANLQTTLVMRGRGGLSISHGAVELFNRATPSRAISSLGLPHPYALAGKPSLIDGIKEFIEITNHGGLIYSGGRSSNTPILTASGEMRPAAYVPIGYKAHRSDTSDDIALATFDQFRDFQADLAALNIEAAQGHKVRTLELPIIHPFTNRSLYSTDIARLLDDTAWVMENVRAWKPHLIGLERLGMPAVLGLDRHAETFELLQDTLGVTIFEIPTLPPSIPGLRLERVLRRFAETHGARVIEGPTARGRVMRHNGKTRAAGVAIDSAGRQSVLDSKYTILATGSILNGGLVASQDGRVYEPTFNIPVKANSQRAGWVADSIFEDQEYSKFGVTVNSSLQPLDIHGEIMLDNLYAIGGLLKGADRTREGSRQGIDIATAYRAIEHIKRSST